MSHRIKCLACIEDKGEGKGRWGVDWSDAVYSEKEGLGRSEGSMRDKWRTHLSVTRLSTLSFLYCPHSLFPILLSACGPSSRSCHYRGRPVNQSFLIQWHVGRGHVTYVKRREWGDFQAAAARSKCVQDCAYAIKCLQGRARSPGSVVWQRQRVTGAVVTHEARDQLWVTYQSLERLRGEQRRHRRGEYVGTDKTNCDWRG